MTRDAGGKGRRDRRPSDFDSNFEDSTTGGTLRPRLPAAPPRRPTATSSRPPRRTQSGSLPSITAGPPGQTAPFSRFLGRPKANPAEAFRRKRQNSVFDDDEERTQIDELLGRSPAPAREEKDEDELSLGTIFDGVQPAKECTSAEIFKAVNAPVKNREGRRAPEVYRRVINQFAVGHNPRYRPDAPDRPRAHIFVWDVTRAMQAEVPHFWGIKELNLAQTCDWLRFEGPLRGWLPTDRLGAVNAAGKGMPVLAMPREIRLKLIAVVRPGELDKDGRPKVAAAARQRGNSLTLLEALGVFAVEFFYHL